MRIRSFAWQEGYGAVTVSPSDVPRVRRYIASQTEHHRKKTFQEEYREILVESGIPFDERYLLVVRPPLPGRVGEVGAGSRGSQKTLTPG